MSNWRIMVVDDDQNIRQMVKATLSGDYEIVEAHDGLDAIEKLAEFQPDFIIMDIMMPVMNGLEASISIRENPKFNHIPILFLSALSTREDLQKAYRSGADLYLTKPVDPSHLIKSIQNCLKKHPYSPMKKDHTIEELRERKKQAVRLPDKPIIKRQQRIPNKAESDKDIYKEMRSKRDLPRIMIVDDDIDMLDFLKLSLLDHFEIVCAMDGIEAIQKMVMYQPDIFILDIMLPKMSGYQLCQSIRRNRTYKTAPILMISAKSSRKDKEYAYRMGANSYLAKPFCTKDLVSTLKKIIDSNRLTVKRKTYSMQALREKDEETRRERELKQKFDEKDIRILKKQEKENLLAQFMRNHLDGEKK
jgi:DNA-binding response OmpR family regulator